MPDPAQLAFEDASGGMNAADPPHKIATTQVARMVNCRIQDGLPTTRFGSFVRKLAGPELEYFTRKNIQGSTFYNPAKGQGGIVFAESNASLAVAIGGRKYLVGMDGCTGAKIREITGGFSTNPQLHLNWLAQWEDLLVSSDGQGATFVYDSINGASFSKGYNTQEKLKSEIPNGATVLAYVHARGVAVVNGRNVLVGNILHRENFTSSIDLRKFDEQVFWATGKSFLPPSAMGGITAAGILPLQDTTHGHGDLIIHCEDGIFSIDLNVYPRSKWIDTSLVKHFALQSGATGPYALCVRDSDQFYRSRKGMQHLRSARSSNQREAAPEQLLSPEVETWMNGDYGRWLRFASVVTWDKLKRLVATTAPIVQGSYRWHRGIVVRNIDPLYTVARPAVWEGLWTLPPESRGIVQMVGGLFDGRERQFAWTRGEDRINRLVEFSHSLTCDVLADGTRHPIRSQVFTRAIDLGRWWEQREFTETTLYLGNIVGELHWGVWFRSPESPVWKPWRTGKVENSEDCAACDLGGPDPRSLPIHLGKVPDICQPGTGTKSNQVRAIQFLVRWQGFCQFEGIRIMHGSNDLTRREFDKEKLDFAFSRVQGEEYNDFEYSDSLTADWIPEPQ